MTGLDFLNFDIIGKKEPQGYPFHMDSPADMPSLLPQSFSWRNDASFTLLDGGIIALFTTTYVAS